LNSWGEQGKVEKGLLNLLSKKVEKMDDYLRHHKVDDAIDELYEILNHLPPLRGSDNLRSKARKKLTSYRRVYDYNSQA
jgi:hypothetical protein